MLDQITTKPGKKYASIKNPHVYEALRRKGYSKQRAARISNAMVHKSAQQVSWIRSALHQTAMGYIGLDALPGVLDQIARWDGKQWLPEHKDAGAPLAGPGGLLGTPGLGTTRPRRWGNRRKHKACTCGVNVATKEQIAPGITRIRGNLCNVHGRYGPCDAAASKKPPKGGKGRKPKASPKPKVTPEQRAQERAAQQAANRAAVLTQLGIAADGQEALAALRRGEQPDPAAIARLGGVAAGLVEQASDGSYRLSASGRAMLAAADAGDAGRAGDTISSARDRTSARTQRQEAAAQRARDAEAKRAAAAAEAAKKKPAKGGGGGKGSSSSSSSSADRESERQADRARRQQEHEQDRAQRQREHEQDRAQRQRERSEDRAAQLEARRSRGTVATTTTAERVAPYRIPVEMPKRRPGPRKRQTTTKTFIVYKDASGAPRWLARTTTAYRDRDREILMLAALDADSVRMTAAKQFGPLRWWHVGRPDPLNAQAPWGPGLDIGDCDFSMQIGTTRVESGTFRSPELAQRIADTADQYELSPGFFHPPDQPGADGVYTTLKTFERSIVPTRYGRASNLYTGLTVKEHSMDEQEQARRFKAMVDTLGLSPDQAAQFAAGLVQTDKSAQAQGVTYKSDDAPEVLELADGTRGIIQDNRFVALKAAMAPASMMQAGETEEADAAEAEGDEGDAQYVGDMAPAEFRDMLIDAFQEAIQSFGSGISSKMAEMDEAVKGLGYARMKSEQTESATGARIAQLEAELKSLKGEQPAVVEHEALAALKSTGPSSPPDANALPQPENAVQAAAMRTFPQLYQTNPNGQWAGWVPPSTS